MLSIFIPQETLEDIVIDNMASTMEVEEQDTWFKIFTKQEFVYVSSWEEKDYLTQEDPLFLLSDSYGVEIRYATDYMEAIPEQPESVLDYWNGIFLLDISEEDAARIQKDYGVICQSVNHLDASVLMDPGLKFSPNKGDADYSWHFMLEKINGEHIPSNHLMLIDRYLFPNVKEMERSLDNVFAVMDAMLPLHELQCPYKITIVYAQQKDGESVGLSQVAHEVYDLVSGLNRPYPINVEVVYLTPQSALYKPFHNRRILTNYTITELEYKVNAFDDDDNSTCLQTIDVQGLFSSNGLNGYCDSPHKNHDDMMSLFYKNLVWWVWNYLTPESSYAFNGKKMYINKKYEVRKNGKISVLFEKRC